MDQGILVVRGSGQRHMDQGILIVRGSGHRHMDQGELVVRGSGHRRMDQGELVVRCSGHRHMGHRELVVRRSGHTACRQVIMKNFNRRDCHGHHGSKRRELARHAHSHGSHAFTHILYTNHVVRSASSAIIFQCMLGLFVFRVSVIHRTLTWTTGYVKCVCDHSCACVYTRGLGTQGNW